MKGNGLNVEIGVLEPSVPYSHSHTRYGLSCIRGVTYETVNEPGPRLNIKTVLSTYGDFHVKDKTAVRTSYL